MENTHHTVEDIFFGIVGGCLNYTASWKPSGNGSLLVRVPWVVFIIIIILPILVVIFFMCVFLLGIRLAVGNADRVIFVLAASILTYYQVPHTAFYVYISVVVFTGFLQTLRWESPLRYTILDLLGRLTLGLSEAFLLRCTSLHFRNPFSRRRTESHAIYLPVGSPLPLFQTVRHFQFEIPDDFDAGRDHELTVGDCKLKIKTIQQDNTEGTVEQGIESVNRIRSLQIEAPWGEDRVTFEMNDDNLGRLLSYLGSLMESENTAEHCKKLICSRAQRLGGDDLDVVAMTLPETIKHFNDGGKLVLLEYVGEKNKNCYEIF